jgi:hypothetical protein
VSLSLLEEHCQHLESIKQDTTLTVEQLIPILQMRAEQIRPFYGMIDKLEESVRQINETVERMQTEVTLAENLLSSPSPFSVTKVFSSLINSRKKTVPGSRIRYDAPAIFSTRQLFSANEENCEQGSEACESPPIVFTVIPQSVQPDG